MGVAVTIADGGDGLFFFLFFLSCCQTKKQAEGTKRPRPFFHRQLRELHKADFHKPGIYGNNGLARRMCFVTRRFEVVAVAGLLWISWCVLGGANF